MLRIGKKISNFEVLLITVFHTTHECRTKQMEHNPTDIHYANSVYIMVDAIMDNEPQNRRTFIHNEQCSQ
jgi:hypothetical protein